MTGCERKSRYAIQLSKNEEKPRAAFTTIADQRGPVVGDGSDGGAQTGCVEKGHPRARRRTRGQSRKGMEKGSHNYPGAQHERRWAREGTRGVCESVQAPATGGTSQAQPPRCGAPLLSHHARATIVKVDEGQFALDAHADF
ncbi:uncharacterized protein N7458_006199 [Penicillium daleae]|uniref:Uncharacterized protein n=1 Tax=Penicillium daleae TaxID=63821 RepID=A0AAD6C630_9EURO|nr:uncharacterized protein N7458_006199 [Penicillium daleae]KAJ5449750.1 hypothetical protein N7458_006199 [Penicillium daleae]